MSDSSLVKIQEFVIYNTSGQRLQFPGLVIPTAEARRTTDVRLFEIPAVKRALETGLIQVVPDPRNYFGGSSAIPEAVDSGGGGGGGGSGDGNILRAYRNFDTVNLPRGSPVYSPSPGQMFGALGNLSGRNVIGLVAASSDVVPGAQDDVLVDGTLVASTAEWEVVTGMVGGLVRGRKYCLDLNVPGKLRLSVTPTGTQQYLVNVGYAISATEFKLEVQPIIRIS